MNSTNARSLLARATLVVSGLVAATSCAPNDGVESADRTAASSVERIEQPLSAEERRWFVTPLVVENEQPPERFGWAVALSGNTAVVSAAAGIAGAVVVEPGAAYVFVHASDGWHQQAKLVPPAEDAGDFNFGQSVAISGDTIVVGAPNTTIFAEPSGAAYVYQRSGTTWGSPVALSASDAHWEFGVSVAVSGDHVVVGAPSASVVYPDEGAAYVFTRSGSTWQQAKKLLAETDANIGNRFGAAVAISGTTVLVGAQLAPSGNFIGRAYVYSGMNWDEDMLFLPEPYCCDEFGSSVAIDGDVAVVGARSHRGRNWALTRGYNQGGAFVYTRSTSGWTRQLSLFAQDGIDQDAFGQSVSVSGNIVMVGAPGQGTNAPAVLPADSAYVFDRLTGPTMRDRIGSRGATAHLGGSVSIDGDLAVVGTSHGYNGAYGAEYLSTDGGQCGSNTDCGSGHCVAGVCCNEACTGRCESCANDRGECTPVLEQSPGNPSCSPYVCNGSSSDCPMNCTSSAQCIATNHCRNGSCVDPLPNGETCTERRACRSERCVDGKCAGTTDNATDCSSAADCESGFCVDGLCCDRRCEGQCEACDVRGSRGVCSPVTGEPRGDREPCLGTDPICKGRCNGALTARCFYEPGSERCGSSCENDEQTDSFCDGEGACVQDDAPRSCNNLKCANDSVCLTECTENSDCVAGTTCQDGTCTSGATCFDDWNAQDTNGDLQECAPYRCESGSCRMSCDTQEDCTDDTLCTNGECVTRPARAAASTNDSGGCSVARYRSSEAPWALWGFSIIAACAALRVSGGQRTRRGSGRSARAGSL
jgi:hypothetical protein